MRASRFLLLAGLAAMIIAPILAGKAKRDRPSIGDETSDEIDLVTIFEGRELRSRATAFRGGRALCWYGGGEIDLVNATPDPAGIRLQVTCVFGGLTIRVPLDWKVDVKARSVFGGTADGRPTIGPAGAGAPTLVLEARSVFGGVGVLGPREEVDSTVELAAVGPAVRSRA
jgi:hypothetical protein